MKTHEMRRREFLKFMGKSAVAAAGTTTALGLASCLTPQPLSRLYLRSSLPASLQDNFSLVPDLTYRILLQEGEAIAPHLFFGTHNDYTAFIPLDKHNPNDGLLWVNHEYFSPLFVTGRNLKKHEKRKLHEVEKEEKVVGGSIVRIKRHGNGWFSPILGDSHNRRLDATTPIPFAGDVSVLGSKIAIGTLGNCAGGLTPWGTVLTCEEQYDAFYGERLKDGTRSPSAYGWESALPYPTEHYGWVVEVDPLTGHAQKHTSMGRFGHESATTRLAHDGRCVVYSGDDDPDRCLYKFISDKAGDLTHGTLYVANIEKGTWISLDIRQNAKLQSAFDDQLDVLIHCREAAQHVGGTPLARPEDIEIDPHTGAIIIALSNHKKQGNYHGSLLRIAEKNNDPLALEFSSSTLLTGGPDSLISSPDNLAFDREGNLWVTNDISSDMVEKGPYKGLGANALFCIPMLGEHAGLPVRVATAPIDAELTGLSFSPDGKSLFVSVQHPGETSTSLDSLTSHWPNGAPSLPKSAVVEIQRV